VGVRKFEFPQGLKPNRFASRSGTAKAVPFQIGFVTQQEIEPIA
jgi:hypothetical protein